MKRTLLVFIVTMIMIISSMAIATASIDGNSNGTSANNPILNGVHNTPFNSQSVNKNVSVTDPQINLYWKNMISNNYAVNTSVNNTVFVAPYTNVSFNVSSAFYDLNSSITYKDASYKWYSSGIKIYNDTGYNASVNFSKYTGKEANISINATASNGYDNTTFHVYIINPSVKPVINTTVEQYSKIVNETSGKYRVDQGQFTCVYGYNSSLKVYNTDYNVPLTLNWTVNNSTYIGSNLTYTFEKPFTNVTLHLNVTGVTGSSTANTNSTKLTFYIKDTTPPVPVLTLTNATGVTVKNPTVGSPAVFSANGSYDKYYAHNVTYKWSIMYSNGTKMNQSTNTYEITKGNSSARNITLKIYTYKSVLLSLKVTNPLNVSAYLNKTYTPVVTTPRLVVNNIYIPGNLSEGIKSTIHLNVSNDGTVTANSYKLYVIIDGKTYSQSYTTPIDPSAHKNLSFTFTPGVTGKYTVTAKAFNSNEPSSFFTSSQHTASVTINRYPYEIPIIIGAVVAAIIVIGVVYFEASKRRSLHPRQRKVATKPETKSVDNTEQKKIEGNKDKAANMDKSKYNKHNKKQQ